MKLLVIGSSNTDLVVHTKNLPKPGETVLGGDFFVNPGGKGANQAVGAARTGGDVTFCCKTGEDGYGYAAKKLIQAEGINTEYVFTSKDKPSGVALICVDDSGENSIVVASGSNMELRPEDIDGIADFQQYDIVLVQLEIPMETVAYVALLAKKYGVRLVLNPAPAAALSTDLLSSVSIITPNETEAGIISGISVVDDESAALAAARIHEMGVEQVIITMGARGALLLNESGSKFIPAFKSKAVDTTAAGDVFNGALCVALSEGKDMESAIRFGSAAASIAVSRPGAQASVPTREEVDLLLNSVVY